MAHCRVLALQAREQGVSLFVSHKVSDSAHVSQSVRNYVQN